MTAKNIKLKEIEIENVKNVSSGIITLESNDEISNVIGIYGQNGSGKTTVIDILDIFNKFVSRKELEQSDLDLLDYELISGLQLTFRIDQKRDIRYCIKLKKVQAELDILESSKQSDIIEIHEESIYTKLVKKNARWKTLIEFKRTSNDSIDKTLSPAAYFPKTKATKNLIDIAISESENDKESFVFSRIIHNSIFTSENKKITTLQNCYETLENISRNMFVFSNRISGVINAQIASPFLFSYSKKNEKDKNTITYGTIGLPAEDIALIPKDALTVFTTITKQINGVLPHIIPGIKIILKNYGEQKTDKGKEGYRVELLSHREGKTFPFRSESDGIKKIVSLLSVLINVYNNKETIVAIDELDSGIFEFLLGELITVFSDGAKGQIIFTSHNLRPLEVLSEKKIIFTTTDKNNRYVKAKSIKNTNNLRDIYIRTVQLDNLEDKSLYNSTNTALIQKSFRKSLDLNEKLDFSSEESKHD